MKIRKWNIIICQYCVYINMGEVLLILIINSINTTFEILNLIKFQVKLDNAI